ncbi:MAG: diguanylate cyclase [bacterium]|nr:diguanylate cyclase [bacterium]
MSQSRKIQFKLVFRFSIIFLILFLLIFGVLSMSFRYLTLKTAKDNAQTIAKTIRDGITSLMVLGVIDQRDVFLKGMMDTETLSDIRKLKVIRGQVVIKQFGMPHAIETAETDMEKQVFVTGEMQEQLVEGFDAPLYNLVIPYKASEKGRINCLSCHHAEEGQVLGAISISVDLSHQRSVGLWTILTISILTLSSIGFIFWMIYRFFTPYSAFFAELQAGFRELESGHMDHRVSERLDDEAGDVAHSFNGMMDSLKTIFSDICHKVYLLVGYEFVRSGNVITDTVYNVDQLLQIYNFKKNVEREETKYDVYVRIQEAIKKLGAMRFGVYEVNSRKNEFSFMLDHCVQPEYQTEEPQRYADQEFMDQLSQQPIQDCAALIQNEPNLCPVVKFKSRFDSKATERYCKYFPEAERGANPVHKCIPRFGADMATIVQIICPPEENDQVDALVPYIKSYMEQASSVLEIKNAMEFIREQSLKDELTTLYNRRYLEEISNEFLDKHKDRRVGFMMIDIDHFKKVNDEQGHDAGDLILRGIALVIKKSVGPKDIVIRFGGEEIMVLSFHTRSGETKKLAQRIRENIEEATFPYGNLVIKKTASIGYTEYPESADHFWICIKHADIAMYSAKRTGRNKVVKFKPELVEQSEEEN